MSRKVFLRSFRQLRKLRPASKNVNVAKIKYRKPTLKQMREYSKYIYAAEQRKLDKMYEEGTVPPYVYKPRGPLTEEQREEKYLKRLENTLKKLRTRTLVLLAATERDPVRAKELEKELLAELKSIKLQRDSFRKWGGTSGPRQRAYAEAKRLYQQMKDAGS